MARLKGKTMSSDLYCVRTAAFGLRVSGVIQAMSSLVWLACERMTCSVLSNFLHFDLLVLKQDRCAMTYIIVEEGIRRQTWMIAYHCVAVITLVTFCFSTSLCPCVDSSLWWLISTLAMATGLHPLVLQTNNISRPCSLFWKLFLAACFGIVLFYAAIAVYDDGENRAVPLLDKAKDVDNLCQLDPASYPWFWVVCGCAGHVLSLIVWVLYFSNGLVLILSYTVRFHDACSSVPASVCIRCVYVCHMDTHI